MSTEQNMENNNQTTIRPDLLQALVDHAEHGITIAEREGDDTILLYVNKAFEEMTGYSSDECLYKDCRFLQGDDNDQTEIKKIHKAIENEEPVRVILRNYNKNGNLFWNDLTITPFFDKVEGVMYYIGVQKNVSDKIALEDEIASLKAQLATQS